MVFEELLNLAEELNTEVLYNNSIISKSYVVEFEKDLYCVNIDKERIASQEDMNVCLAHELGHVQSGTLYYNNATKLYRGSAEYRADYRAAKQLIPIEQLKKCVFNGIIEKYELAEVFEVTEEFIDKVLSIYSNKGLLIDITKSI
ncbi:MAG: ImmA/IrrE family metallo-endopeptidase [Bacilli bacterium]